MAMALTAAVAPVVFGAGAAQAGTDNARIVFYVAWYDVGKAALEGLPGIKKVSRGFHNFREINTVEYDPALISTDEMISALRKAGTFRGVAE